MLENRDKPRRREGGGRRLLVVTLLALGLLVALPLTQVSCKATISKTRHLAECGTCGGSGNFGKGKCPSCSGVGHIKVSYSYPVIAPGKSYPDDRLPDY